MASVSLPTIRVPAICSSNVLHGDPGAAQGVRCGGFALTACQLRLLRYVAAERAWGREPSYRDMARALGWRSPGGARDCMLRIRDRIGPDGMDALLPRAPDGARLRFVAVEGLS